MDGVHGIGEAMELVTVLRLIERGDIQAMKPLFPLRTELWRLCPDDG